VVIARGAQAVSVAREAHSARIRMVVMPRR
jgi:hypothetical protein